MKDARLGFSNAALLTKTVDMLDKIPMDDRDTKGDFYEYMLGKIASAGTNGQLRTPRHIIQTMIEMMRPTPEDVICEACRARRHHRRTSQAGNGNQRRSHQAGGDAGMTVVALAEIADQIRGVSCGKAGVVDRPAKGFLPVLRANNITHHGLSFDDLVYVRAEKVAGGCPDPHR